MMWETIQTQVQQGVATLSFNRADSLNSFNQQMHEEVQQVLKNWNTDPNIRVIVIRGNGRAFSAGQDLKNVLDSSAMCLCHRKARWPNTIIP